MNSKNEELSHGNAQANEQEDKKAHEPAHEQVMSDAPRDEAESIQLEGSYSESGFWHKLNGFAKTAGREVVHKSLCLYYAAQHPDTPAWARATVYSALGYFILPTDAIPDLTPLLGFSDDLGALSLALTTIAAYVTPPIKQQARDKLLQWFGPE